MKPTILFVALGLLFAVACDTKQTAPATAATPASPETTAEPEVMAESAPMDHHAHHHQMLPADDIVPGSSLYQLNVALVGQDGKPRTWDDFRGKPVVVAMIYTSCTTACPLIVAEIKQILELSGRQDQPVLLISMDPERDDPAALTTMAKKHDLGPNWTLVRPAPDNVPEIAAALGVRYRRLPSKDFNHSQVIALLDSKGTIVARAEGLGPQRDAVVDALRAPVAN